MKQSQLIVKLRHTETDQAGIVRHPFDIQYRVPVRAPKPARGVSVRSNGLINIYDSHATFLSRDGQQSLHPSRSSRGLVVGFGRVGEVQRDGWGKVAWVIPRMK